MGKAVPEQHPAVVLRSHYNHLRALLIAALIAVLGLAGAVVIVANDDDTVVSTSTPAIEYGGTAHGVPDTAPLPRRLDGAVAAPRRAMTAARTRAAPTSLRPRTRRRGRTRRRPSPAPGPAGRGRHDIRMDLQRLRAGGVRSQGSADVTMSPPVGALGRGVAVRGPTL